MPVRALIVDQLSNQTIIVSVASGGPLRLRKAHEFRLSVTILNKAAQPLEWSVENPLHLAYRWKSAANVMVEPEGLRTTIPAPLLPGQMAEVMLQGLSPKDDGDYVLVVSLVLEGVAWAADVSLTGWCEVSALVSPSSPWPAELTRSIGGRALRGALAARELADEINRAGQPASHALNAALSPCHADELIAAPGEGDRPPGAPVPKQSGIAVRFWAWLRRLNGTQHLLNQLEDTAGRLDQQSRAGFEEIRQNLETRERQIFEIRELIASESRAHHTQVTDLVQSLNMLAADARLNASSVQELLGAVAGIQANNKQSQNAADLLQTSVTALRTRLATDAKKMRSGLDRMTASGSRALQDARAFGLKQDRLLLEVDTLRNSHDGVVRELRQGPAVVELISSIRSITNWVQSENGRPDVAEATVLKLRPALAELRDDLGLQFAKLDSLLHRQVISVPARSVVFVRNRYGLLAIQDHDPFAIAYYSTGDIPEPGTVSLIENLLKRGDTFVDVGANVGIYTLIAARLVQNSGRSIAVEPASSTIRALNLTIAINGIGGAVQVHDVAFGARNGTAELHLEKTSGHNSLLAPLDDRGDKEEVVVRRGDEVLDGLRPSLIKIDVEGAEIDVLEGLRATFAQSHPRLIVEYSPNHVQRSGLDASAWFDAIREFGENVWFIDDRHLTLVPVLRSQDLPAGGGNLFVSDTLPKRLGFMAK
jgi:methyltransferase, FkbM family